MRFREYILIYLSHEIYFLCHSLSFISVNTMDGLWPKGGGYGNSPHPANSAVKTKFISSIDESTKSCSG